MEITLAHISASLHLCSFIHVISLLVFPFSYSLIYTSRPPLSWLLKIKDNYDYQQTEAAAAAEAVALEVAKQKSFMQAAPHRYEYEYL